MDGIHDLGGREGFGAVVCEADEPAFHARWEAAVFAMTAVAGAVGASANTDQFRHAIERGDPAAYLTHGYYGRWLGAVETLMVEAGVISTADIDARFQARAQGRAFPGAVLRAARPRPDAPRVARSAAGRDNRRPLAHPPRFDVGARVRTRAHGHPGHTRLPAYARDCRGTVSAVHGGWVFPDRHAIGIDEGVALYTVAFRGEEMWGPDSEPGLLVHLDLFEPYLEVADHD